MPATIDGLVGGPIGVPMTGDWGLIDIDEADPTLNLLSAASVTNTTIRLTFDRPPSKGTKDPTDTTAYAIASLGVGVAMTVSSAALGTAGAGEYPTTVILTVTKGTNGQQYRVTVTGIDGACGELLATATATWTNAATGPSVTYATGLADTVVVRFTEAIDPATIGLPGAWAVTALGAGVPVAVTSAVATSSTVITLGLDVSMSVAESYRVTAPAAVADLAGNLIVGSTADFVAFAEIITTDTGHERTGEPAFVYATNLAGAPLSGFSPFDLIPETPGDDLVTLARLIVVSLLTDRTALPSDRIPGGSTDKRGWWADGYNEDDSRIGSRLWLAVGQPVRDSTAEACKGYATEALRWMTADKIATAIDVESELQGVGQERRIALAVTAYRDEAGVKVTFPDLWTALEG